MCQFVLRLHKELCAQNHVLRFNKEKLYGSIRFLWSLRFFFEFYVFRPSSAGTMQKKLLRYIIINLNQSIFQNS